MVSNFHFEFTRSEKTPSGERRKSLKIQLAIGVVVVSLVAAMLAAAGYINRDDLPYFFGERPAEALSPVPPVN